MKRVFLLMFSIFIISSAFTFAQWTSDISANTLVSNRIGKNYSPVVAPDGDGGVYIAYFKESNGIDQILLKHLNAAGEAFNSKSILLFQDSGDTLTINVNLKPQLVPDMNGGVYIIYGLDYSFITADVTSLFMKHYEPGGNIYPADSVGFQVGGANPLNYKALSDKNGGLIVIWDDESDFLGSTFSLTVNRIGSNNHNLWISPDTVAISKDTLIQYDAAVDLNGTTDIIATTNDSNNLFPDVTLRYISINLNGSKLMNKQVIDVTGSEIPIFNPVITLDFNGNSIIAWEDERSPNDINIYADKLNSEGQSQWGSYGTPICTASNTQDSIKIISDFHGGAYLAWRDLRDGTSDDIYTQHINSTGQLTFSSQGVGIQVDNSDQKYPVLVNDPRGGVIVVYQNTSTYSFLGTSFSTLNINAAHLDSKGDVLWDKGLSVDKFANKLNPVAVSNGLGGVISAWIDTRNYPNMNIYAQAINRFGNTNYGPAIQSVKDVPNDQGGKLAINWKAAPLDTSVYKSITKYSVWRAISSVSNSKQLKNNSTKIKTISSNNKLRKVSGSYWEKVSEVDAHYLSGYMKIDDTPVDSNANNKTPYVKYFVSAETSDPYVFWDSNIDSAYSVDNLPPAVPNSLYITSNSGNAHLGWKELKTPDLYQYIIYQGTTASFDTAKADKFYTKDTVYNFTASPANSVYKVLAVDIHGNKSKLSNAVGNSVVPVELVSFTANTQGDKVTLNWRTATEKNSDGFQVERADANKDKMEYQKIGFVKSAGNSTSPRAYQFIDSNPVNSNRFYYRIKMIDLDGSVSYSKNIEVEVTPEQFQVYQNYPNPFNPSTTIKYSLPAAAYVNLIIYNSVGKKVTTLVNQQQPAGYHSINFDASNLASGIYFYKLKAGNNYSAIKKMILLK